MYNIELLTIWRYQLLSWSVCWDLCSIGVER